jgi:predicted N-acyltransferase
MEMHITSTIQDVDEKEWNAFVGRETIEHSYAWLKTVEDSGVKAMRYVFLKDGKALTGAACSYVYEEKMYSMKVPFLQVKSPLGSSPAFFSSTPEETHMLVKGLERIRKEEKAQGMLILDFSKEESDRLRDQLKGFTELQTDDNTYIDTDYADFDDYLGSLDEDAWRSARMTLNRARRWKIKTVFTNDFPAWKDVATRLQRYQCEYHNDFRFYMNESFYDTLERTMKDSAELVLFFKDDIPLVSALSLYTGEYSIYKGAGIDPKHKKYHAYFLLYYEAIKRAIEKGHKRIYFGTTTYGFKEKIGCKRSECMGYAKMGNPVLNLALKSFLKVSMMRGERF